MKKQVISAIALACGLVFTGAWAAETNAPASAPKVSKAEKSAAKQGRKTEMTAAEKKGETMKAGEAGAAAPAASGPKMTAAEKKAARAKRRAEMKEATKKGQTMPAGEATPKQ
jgi:hypothetical protein